MTNLEFKKIRKKLKLTQTQFAQELGMSKNMIGFMERGYNGNGEPISIEKRTALAAKYLTQK